MTRSKPLSETDPHDDRTYPDRPFVGVGVVVWRGGQVLPIQRDDERRVQYHYTLVDLFAEWRAGEARAQDDAADAAWVGLDDLGRYQLWDETVRIIHLAAGRRDGS